ncbi:MAG: hypothetical protein ACFFDN_28600, partial [Candidatus Hodarchaeota archaeon]
HKIIASELLKLDLIKTSIRRKIIDEGDFVKKKIRALLSDILRDYLSLTFYNQIDISINPNVKT